MTSACLYSLLLYSLSLKAGCEGHALIFCIPRSTLKFTNKNKVDSTMDLQKDTYTVKLYFMRWFDSLDSNLRLAEKVLHPIA